MKLGCSIFISFSKKKKFTLEIFLVIIDVLEKKGATFM